MSQYAMDFQSFDAETYLVRRLKEHGHAIFTGVSDPEIRRERIRTAILDAGLDCTLVGKNLAGKTETYADLFGRIYAEPLHAKQPKGKRHVENV
jgi:hypothetical protein